MFHQPYAKRQIIYLSIREHCGIRSYDPTPDEIANQCAIIQRGWTKVEWLRRAGFKAEPGVLPPMVARSEIRLPI